jgi:hypothetical protein
MERSEPGEDVPIPRLPVPVTMSFNALLEDRLKSGAVAGPTVSTAKVVKGELVPIPRRLFVSSQKKFAADED